MMYFRTISLAALMIATPNLAMAQENSEIMKELAAMRQVIEAQAAKIAELEQQVQNDNQNEGRIVQLEQKLEVQEQVLAENMNNIQPSAGSNKNDVKVTMRGASPQFSFDDGATTFNLHGRIQVDYAAFDDDTLDLPNQGDIRRLFLGTRGQIDHVWKYSFFADFANGPGGERPTIQDAWMSYNGFDDLTLKVGNQIENYSFEQHVSNLNQSFNERSIVHDAFHPVRSIGATAHYMGDDWTATLGAFGDSPNDNNDTDDQESAYVARLTAAPIHDNGQTLHLAGFGRYATPDQATDTFTYNARPGTRLADANQFASAVVANSDSATTYGLEGFYIHDNWSVGGEYMRVDVDSDVSNDPSFDGWYAQASYFLVGDGRAYNAKKGGLKRVKVANPVHEGGWGAWEIAARYATIDLNDGTIDGGELETTNFALNWFPHNHIQFALNYIMNETSNTGPVPNDETNAIILRSQIDF